MLYGFKFGVSMFLVHKLRPKPIHKIDCSLGDSLYLPEVGR
jgi:hypothetical protein